MIDLVASVLVLVGASFMLLAAIGVHRFPDVFTRMQASAKAATLGVSCALLGAAVEDAGVLIQSLVTIAFFFVTTPVAAQMIVRTAYVTGVPRWHGEDGRASPIWTGPRGTDDGRSSVPPPP